MVALAILSTIALVAFCTTHKILWRSQLTPEGVSAFDIDADTTACLWQGRAFSIDWTRRVVFEELRRQRYSAGFVIVWPRAGVGALGGIVGDPAKGGGETARFVATNCVELAYLGEGVVTLGRTSQSDCRQ
jgi:hypothetical protein